MSGCEKYQELLTEYVDGRSDAIVAHLMECDACRKTAQEMRQVKALVSTLPALTAPEGIERALRQRLAEGRSPARLLAWSWRRPVVAGTVVAAAVLAALLYLMPASRQAGLQEAEAALESMSDLHTQVQLAHMLPPDSPVASRREVPEADQAYDYLYDLEGM